MDTGSSVVQVILLSSRLMRKLRMNRTRQKIQMQNKNKKPTYRPKGSEPGPSLQKNASGTNTKKEKMTDAVLYSVVVALIDCFWDSNRESLE